MIKKKYVFLKLIVLRSFYCHFLIRKSLFSTVTSVASAAMASYTSISQRNTLLIATKSDPASVNIAHNLLQTYPWKSIQTNKNEISYIQTLLGNKVFLWFIDEPLLHLTNIPCRFDDDISSSVDRDIIGDVIFLSRHAAASGVLSLTVHPIGIPWMTDSSQVGGIPGRCSPPNPKISSLYRSLLRETKLRDTVGRFQVTLEATHHGPHVDLPACFVEIGSSENEWQDAEAGLIWSHCLGAELKFPPSSFSLPSSSMSSVEESAVLKESSADTLPSPLGMLETVSDIVVLSIGGGHYVPKMNDLVAFHSYFEAYYDNKISLNHSGEVGSWDSNWALLDLVRSQRSLE